MYKDFSQEKAPFWENLNASAWASMPLTRHSVPTVFGVARPRARSSSSRGVRCVVSPPELIDQVTLVPSRHGSSSRVTVEVAGCDLCVFPYHIGESRLGPALGGCPTKLNSGMAPVVATQCK